MPTFTNPPLEQINPEHLMTAAQAAEQFGVTPGAIRVWVHRGKLTPVDLGGKGPKLYWIKALSEAETEAWDNGADRPLRGGRKRDVLRRRAQAVNAA